jgi:hypothetical protein
MWICPKCQRQFKKTKQPHTCKKVTITEHFKNKKKAKKIFDYLVDRIDNNIGKCKVVSIPCCVHLCSNYDFLAVFPKKEGLEIRFLLNRKLNSPKLKIGVKMSSKVFKNVFYFNSEKEIDNEFIDWARESYNLKGGNG